MCVIRNFKRISFKIIEFSHIISFYNRSIVYYLLYIIFGFNMYLYDTIFRVEL